jgi:hypothetical protein
MDPVPGPTLAQDPQQLPLVGRQRGRAAQGVLAQPGAGQDLAHPGDVEGLAGMAGGGEGEQLSVQVQPGAQHPGGLHRLIGRTRERRGPRLARAEHCLAVRPEHHHGTVVT